MKRALIPTLALAGVLGLFVTLAFGLQSVVALNVSTLELTTSGDAVPEHATLMYVENVGQFPPEVRFQLLGGPGDALWITDDAIWITVMEDRNPPLEPVTAPPEQPDWDARRPLKMANIKLAFRGGNPHPRLEHFGHLETKVNYFLGNDPEKWQTSVPAWAGVRLVDLYPGVDLELSSDRYGFLHRLIADNPGDLEVVALQLEGTENVQLSVEQMVASTALGDVTIPLFLVASDQGPEPGLTRIRHQDRSVIVNGPYTSSRQSAGLSQSAATASGLLYGTYLGGTNNDEIAGLAIDPNSGNIVAGGTTESADFAPELGSYDSHNGGGDIFVAVITTTSEGTDDLLSFTYLGGSESTEYGGSIAVDSQNGVYITGATVGQDFPFDSNWNDEYSLYKEAFVVKLMYDQLEQSFGLTPAYSTMLAGNFNDEGTDIAVDLDGNAYVTGWTDSQSGFPATNPAITEGGLGNEDAFVAKLGPGGDIASCTRIGGFRDDQGRGIALYGGHVWVAGYAFSDNFYTTPDDVLQPEFGGSIATTTADGFVMKLDNSLSEAVWSTYLGGYQSDAVFDIAVDLTGSAFVTGRTRSGNDFPWHENTVPCMGAGKGNYEAFVTKLDADGKNLLYSSYVSGSESDIGQGITFDSHGRAYVVGNTESTEYDGFPLTADAYDGGANSQMDGFVAILPPDGCGLDYVTYFVTSGSKDRAMVVATDRTGYLYVGVNTEGTPDVDTTPGAYRQTHPSNGYFPGRHDIIVGKLDPGRERLWVDGVEVVQSIQCFNWPEDPDCPNNSVPLVADKETTIRLHLSSDVDGFNVDGALHYRNLEQPDDSGLWYEPDAHPQPMHGHPAWRHTLHNGLEWTLTEHHLLSGRARFHIDYWEHPYAEGAPRYRYPADGDIEITFNEVAPLVVGSASVWVQGEFPDPGRVQVAHELTEALFPVDEVALCDLSPSQSFYLPAKWNDWYANRYREFTWMILAQYSLTGWPCDGGKPDAIFFWNPAQDDRDPYGEWLGRLVPRSLFSWDLIPYAIGNDSDLNEAYKTTMAHYLGRVFGLDPLARKDHSGECTIADPGWPYAGPSDEPPNTAIQDVGIDREDWYGCQYVEDTEDCPAWATQDNDYVLVPDGKEELMVARECAQWRREGATEADKPWISGYNVKKLFDALVGRDGSSASVAALRPTAAETFPAGQPVLLVSGSVATDTAPAIGTVFAMTPTLAITQTTGTEYCIQLEDGVGAVLTQSCFDLMTVETFSGTTELWTGFVRFLPHDAAATRLVLTDGVDDLAERFVSVNPPTVTVLYPNGGETLGDQITVTWAAGDPDGNDLTFAVSYSPDNGQNWWHLTANLTDMQLAVDTSTLPGGDQGIFRVTVSDGFLTAEDQSDAPFSVALHPPEPTITSPRDGSEADIGEAVILRGSAYDVEDGTLGDASLSWLSSIEGPLGTGRSAAVRFAQQGSHKVTLLVTDSHGITATESISIHVDFISTGVELASFTVSRSPNLAVVQWETASEVDCLGFNLWRTESGVTGSEKINTDMIPSRLPGSGSGASYSFVDLRTKPGASYEYWLEIVDSQGTGRTVGPAVVKLSPRPIYLPLVTK